MVLTSHACFECVCCFSICTLEEIIRKTQKPPLHAAPHGQGDASAKLAVELSNNIPTSMPMIAGVVLHSCQGSACTRAGAATVVCFPETNQLLCGTQRKSTLVWWSRAWGGAGSGHAKENELLYGGHVQEVVQGQGMQRK